MTLVTAHLSTSLDGYVAGPDQTLDDPLGVGGLSLHQWHFDPVAAADQPYVDRLLGPRGAYVMGRNMFGPVRGGWDSWPGGDWTGWWGEEPPYHAPVFVLTHYAHDPIEMAGGTTFHFVDGFDAALAQAVAVAGELPVDIAGGASAVRQALRADALDELVLDLVPVLLGSGERLLDDLAPACWEQVEVAPSPTVTHLVYRRT